MRQLPRVKAAANLAGEMMMKGRYIVTAMKTKKKPLPISAAKYVNCVADGMLHAASHTISLLLQTLARERMQVVTLSHAYRQR